MEVYHRDWLKNAIRNMLHARGQIYNQRVVSGIVEALRASRVSTRHIAASNCGIYQQRPTGI